MKLSFISGCALLAGIAAAVAQISPTPAERDEHWRQDLQALASVLKAPGGQKDILRLYPKFDADVAALAADVPSLSDAEVVLRLMRLIAGAGVAHNAVQIPIGMGGFLNRLPLTFQWFADGLAVIGAAPDYSTALGARVVSIGGVTPEQFLVDIAPYVSHESEDWLRELAPDFMNAHGVLLHFRMIDADGRVIMKLEKPGGDPLNLAVVLADRRVKRVSLAEGLHVPATLSASRPGEYYWYEYLPESQTMYIQYNACENDPRKPFGDFSRQMLAEADAQTVKRVVIDLRQNEGGDSAVINPLMAGLAARHKSIGHVYALIGPMTFSSAVIDAARLHHSLSATLVGEPTGGMLNGYGEARFITLPNSKLTVSHTTKNFGTKGTVAPDLAVAVKLADVLAGHDPALNAAIAAR